jgi:cbb3-type cytochrome oxidase maturation protein
MTVLFLLIFASLALAGAFLFGFIWAVRAGQFEDTCTPSMRVLMESSENPKAETRRPKEVRNPKSENGK